MDSRSRAERFSVSVKPEFFKMAHIRRGMWYESPEEIEAGLEWGRRKAELLRWIRRKIGRRLTLVEQRYFLLHFFKGLTFNEIAEVTGKSNAAIHRSVAQAVRKLRESAKHSDIPPRHKKRTEEEPVDESGA